MRYYVYATLFFIIANCNQLFAATRYASPSGAGSTCSTDTRCTLSTGLSLTQAGDTLILGDGIYNQRVTSFANGTSGAYIIIKAEHDGEVIIRDSSNTGSGVLYKYGMSYTQWEGLRIESTATGGALSSSLFIDSSGNHNKFLRCAFVVTPCLSGQTVCANHSNVVVSGNYNLIEDSWVWGGGRYKLQFYGGDSTNDTTGSYNIARRVVIRHDREYSGGFNPQATFANYQGHNNLYQNCISIDSDQLSSYDGVVGVWKGPWWLEKGQKSGFVKIKGSMALHYGKYDSPAIFDNCISSYHGQAAYECGNITISDFVGVDGGGGFKGSIDGYPVSRTLAMDHSFIGNTSSTGAGNYSDMGSGFSAGNSSTAQSSVSYATNSIFYSVLKDAYGGNALNYAEGPNDYNVFFGNFNNRNNSTTGAHDITATNPTTSAMLFPVRVEDTSSLKGTGSGGSDVGPSILKKIGRSGTLYGEAGYDDITSDNLWPWPNEDRIKTDMSSYPANWPVDNLPSPVRGFTSGTSIDGAPQTLTKYIWESLGNQIPPEVYGVFPPSTGITLGTGGTITFGTGGGGSLSKVAQ